MEEQQKFIKDYQNEYCNNLMKYCKTYNIMGISALHAGIDLANISLPDIYVPIEMKQTKSSPVSVSRGIWGGVGSGKTALLQMYTYTFLSLYYPEECYPMAKYFREELGISMEPLLPIFIYIPRWKDRSFECFEDMLITVMADFMESESFHKDFAKEKAKELLYAQENLRIIIDGLDAFGERDKKELLQTQIVDYMREHPQTEWILSSRYEEDMNFCKEVFDIYKLKPLIFEEATEQIQSFVEKWLEAVIGTEEEVLKQAKASYKQAVKRNVMLSNLKTPLEITSMLINAYQNNYYFPVQYGEMNRNMLYLRLNWNAEPKYEVRDVECQLAYIAYKMSIRGRRSIIWDKEQLFKCLYDARINQEWLYEQEWGVEEEELTTFIDYLITGIGVLSLYDGRRYGFTNSSDRDYLAARCIADRLFSIEESRKSPIEVCKKVDFSVVLEVFRREDELRKDILEWISYELRSNKKSGVLCTYQFWLAYVGIFAVENASFSLEKKRIMWEGLLKSGKAFLYSISKAWDRRMIFTAFFNRCNTIELDALWKQTVEFWAREENSENISKIKNNLMRIWILVLLTESASETLVEGIWDNLPLNLIVEELITMYQRLYIPDKTKKIIKKMALDTLEQEENPTPAYCIVAALNLNYSIDRIFPTAVTLLGCGNLAAQLTGINYIHLAFNFYKFRKTAKEDLTKQEVVKDCQKLLRSHLYYCIEEKADDGLIHDCIRVYDIVCSACQEQMKIDATVLFYMRDYARRTMRIKSESLRTKFSCALLDFCIPFCCFYGTIKKFENVNILWREKMLQILCYRKHFVLDEWVETPQKMLLYLKREMQDIVKNIFGTDTLPPRLEKYIHRAAKKYVRKMKI